MTQQTVKVALDQIEQLLAEAGIRTPSDDAKALIAHVLSVCEFNLSVAVSPT